MEKEQDRLNDLTPEEALEKPEEEVSEETAVEPVEEPAAEPAEETEEPAEESAEETAAEEASSPWFKMEPEGDGEEPPLPPVKKKSGWIGWAVLGVVLIAAAVALAVWLGKPAAEPTEETTQIRIAGTRSYTVETEAITDETAAVVVAENVPTDLGSKISGLFGGKAAPEAQMTNGDLAVYYWNAFYQFSNQYYYYLSMMGLDPKTMDETDFEEGQTWQEFFLSRALMAFQAQSSVYQTAMAEGFALPEEMQTEYDEMMADLTEMEDIEDQLLEVYGPGVTLEDYLRYMKTSYYYTAYLDRLQEDVTFTDEDLSAYYDENAETYQGQGVEKDDRNMVNVRHILVQPEDKESEDSWKEAEVRAQEIYDRWQREGATEDLFATLAEMETEDPGSQSNGGLYEDVYPGQMVEAFNDWCFDDSRQPGDTDIVRTDYGYHIMYFVGTSDKPYWKKTAEQDYITAKANDKVEQIVKTYALTYRTEDMALALPGQIAAQEAEG